jgi:hypothetical protein
MPENDPWFESIGADTALSHSELRTLQEDGFVVTRGPVPTADLTRLARAYDSAVLQADPADVKEGFHYDARSRFRESWTRVRRSVPTCTAA